MPSSPSCSSLVALCIGAAVPYLVDELGAPGWTYGVAYALFSAGTIASVAAAGSHRFTMPWDRVLLVCGVLYGAICLAGVAVAWWPVFAASWFVWGLAFGPEQVTCDVHLVATTPDHLRGRMYSPVHLLAGLGGATGYAIAGPLIGVAGARVVIALGGAGYLLAAPAFFLRRAPTPPEAGLS